MLMSVTGAEVVSAFSEGAGIPGKRPDVGLLCEAVEGAARMDSKLPIWQRLAIMRRDVLGCLRAHQ